MIFTLGSLFSMSLLAPQLQAATSVSECNYFIAPNGSDRGTGSVTSPWATISYASARLSPGMKLCARGGTYYNQAGLIWHSSGTSTAPVTFTNYPGEKPVFDGQWGETGTDGDFLIFSNNSWVVVEGLTIQHFADQYGNGAIDIYNGQGPVSNIVIQNCKFYDNGTHTAQDHHIYIAAGSKNITIRNNRFERAAGSAIQSYHTPVASGIKVYNNVIIGGDLIKGGRQSWGLMISDATDAQIYNNTIYGMARGGIEFNYGSVAPGPGPYVVKNNIIANTSGAGIRVTSPYTPYFSSDYNLFYGNTTDVVFGSSSMTRAQFAASTGNDQHSISADPLFVASGSNFHLKATSPAIDKATSMNALAADLDGSLRPSGAALDIGAYEYQSAVTALAKASFSTSSLYFGYIKVGYTSTKFVTITNTGTGALSFPKAFAVSGTGYSLGGQGTCKVGVSYAPKASCTIAVVFKPTIRGSLYGSLSVLSNASTTPVKVALSGKGY